MSAKTTTGETDFLQVDLPDTINWRPYPKEKPKERGKYLVGYNDDDYDVEIWKGEQWAGWDTHITHFAVITPPMANTSEMVTPE